LLQKKHGDRKNNKKKQRTRKGKKRGARKSKKRDRHRLSSGTNKKRDRHCLLQEALKDLHVYAPRPLKQEKGQAQIVIR